MSIQFDSRTASDIPYRSILHLTPPLILLRMLTNPLGNDADVQESPEGGLSAHDILHLVQNLGPDKAARLLCNASGATRRIGYARLPAGFPDDCYPHILQKLEEAIADLREIETARCHDVTSIVEVGDRDFDGPTEVVATANRGRILDFLLDRPSAPLFIGAETDVHLKAVQSPTYDVRIDFLVRERLLQEINLLVDRELSLMDEGRFRAWTSFGGEGRFDLPALTGPLDSFAVDCAKHLHDRGLSFIRQVLVDWLSEAVYSVLLDVPYGRFLHDEEGCPSAWVYHTSHRRAVSAAIARFTNPAFSHLVRTLAIGGPFGGRASIHLVSGPREPAYEEGARFTSLLSAMKGVCEDG